MTSLRELVRAPNESQLQSQIVEGLRYAGYICLETGRPQRQTRCPQCGAYHTPRTGTSNTPGTPDLFVSHKLWRPGTWIGLELKTPASQTLLGRIEGGRLRPEQRALAEQGRILVVRSLDEALRALEAC